LNGNIISFDQTSFSPRAFASRAAPELKKSFSHMASPTLQALGQVFQQQASNTERLHLLFEVLFLEETRRRQDNRDQEVTVKQADQMGDFGGRPADWPGHSEDVEQRMACASFYRR